MELARTSAGLAVLLFAVAAVGMGCHLVFPFEVQDLEREGGLSDATMDTTLDAPADASSSEPHDSHSDRSSVDLAAQDAGWSPPGTWVTIKAGSFMMGSPALEPCRQPDEVSHKVFLTRSFQIQTTEVTQQQFKAIQGFNPATFTSCGATCAVEGINYYMAAAYCNELSKRAGLTTCYNCSGSQYNVICTTAAAFGGKKIYGCPGYRLPTEAEWEYAYRAGTSSAYYNGANNSNMCSNCMKLDINADAISWYCANKGNQGVRPVAGKKPNAWGLYDMAGNLWEWCHDYSLTHTPATVTDPAGIPTGSLRIARGGSWFGNAQYLRAAHRIGLDVLVSGGTDGFRCVRSLK